MKNILVYSVSAIVLLLLSLFLPYEQHDLYAGGFFKPDVLLRSGLKTNGFSHVAAYFPALFIIVSLIIIKLNENLATAIVALVLSFGSFIYMGFLAIALQFHINIFNGPRNYELQIGYYLALITIIAYLVVTVVHLIAVIRKQKRVKKSINYISNSDLLDD